MDRDGEKWTPPKQETGKGQVERLVLGVDRKKAAGHGPDVWTVPNSDSKQKQIRYIWLMMVNDC